VTTSSDDSHFAIMPIPGLLDTFDEMLDPIYPTCTGDLLGYGWPRPHEGSGYRSRWYFFRAVFNASASMASESSDFCLPVNS
jgi:hypothetical protein